MSNTDLVKGVVFVEVTDACNYSCQHCYLGELPKFAKENARLPNMLRALDNVRAMAINEVRFTGGEPLLAPSLSPLIEYCRARKLRYTIVSNGSGIAPLAATAMRNYRPRLVWLSIYGNTPILHDRMTKRIGSLRRLKEIVKCFSRDNIECGAHVVVWPPLVGHIAEILDFVFQELRVSEVKCIPIQYSGAAISARERLLLNATELDHVRSEVNSWSLHNIGRRVRLAGRLTKASISKCGCMFQERVFLTINHMGDISPCCLLMHNDAWLFSTTSAAVEAAGQISDARLPCDSNRKGVCPLLLEDAAV